MLKKFFFLSLCFFSPLLADEPSNAEKQNLQIGRYQMVAMTGSRDRLLYLLDTATGQVWKSTAKENWIEHDYWQLQIATGPDQ